MKKSKSLGKNTSPVEINLTQYGMWLNVNEKEFFLSYKDYPFFMQATINDIYLVELHHKTHLYWPTIDVDLCTEILKNPQQFPLIAK